MTLLPFPIFTLRASDPEFKHLFEVDQPPSQIQVMARSREDLQILSWLPAQGLAIVGTRRPEPSSVYFLQRLLRGLSGTSLVVLSGMANGVDAAAHLGALTSGLRTIGILGCGLNVNYPSPQLELKKKILLSGSLLVSEFPADEQAYPSHFLLRNRLIAQWSSGVCVIEAGQKSGALNTARWAAERHIPCFAVPCFPGDSARAGNAQLLDRDHALGLWGRHSLGAVWLSLATQNVELALPPVAVTDSDLLVQRVARSHTNSVSTLDLLEWATEAGWTHERFFEALEIALNNRQIFDESGFLGASVH